jgi:hypothetical protein
MNISKLIIAFLLLIASASQIYGQGCVAIRSSGCSGNLMDAGTQSGFLTKGQFMVSSNYRYFKSFRHFRGSEEETHRLDEGTEVINIFNSIELGVSYGINDRLSVSVALPFNFNNRSSMYEHLGNSTTTNPDRLRFETNSGGLSDIRISSSYWLFDPFKATKGNVALGVGVKLPTGRYDVEGDFYRKDDDGSLYTINRPVDQSIQLGDGGLGWSLESQGFLSLHPRFSLFYNGFYMINPKNTNGILRNPMSTSLNVASYFSVVDQYAARIGAFYSLFPAVSLSMAGRLEGIPATDLVGESEGFRRPGYVISAEPGLVYFNKNLLLNLNVPIALYRNRIKSTSDKINGSHGDAAFADYLINFSVAYFFNSPGHADMNVVFPE